MFCSNRALIAPPSVKFTRDILSGLERKCKACHPVDRSQSADSSIWGDAMRYDAIVIGSGQGGNPLSYALADRGWSVALIEKNKLGGTCVNTGCTPTKTMIASAQVAHYARNGARWGIVAENVRVDLPAVVAKKNAVVQIFRGGNERRVAERKTLRLYRDHARFTGPHTIQVEGETLESERIFIDTGTRPDCPQLAGLETVGYLTNESIMELQEIPEHLLVLGGGYIGLEFGQMFRRFGSRVTVIHIGDQLLAREDADVSASLQKALEAEGIEFHLQAKATKIEKQGSEITITVAKGDRTIAVTGTHVLCATGRRPNTADLGLEKAGVAVDSHGYIKVNGRMETSAPGVWALGDVKGGPAFTHISYNDYQILWANIIEGKNLSIENRYVPYSLFTDPQLGRVGMTEKEARASGRKLKMGSFPMANVSRAIERDETAGFMKIIIDAETDKILGASILGVEGGEIVQILGAMMLAGVPYTILKGAVFIHPTLAEGFFGLLNSVKPVD
jgi:pyruvate/2-oxoglutarate dehydrogenase complex dihydrolipoamide dehydrogenase (E3) component